MSTTLLQQFKRHTAPIKGAFYLYLLVMAFSSQAADVSFTATFAAPTCTVSSPATIDFGNIGTGNIKYGFQPAPFSVTLSGCSGWLTALQKPGISVSGTGNTNSGDFLFMLPATSTVVNYGVLLKTDLDGTVLSNNTFIPATGSAGSLPANGTTIGLNATLSCGTKCNDPETRAGVLNAAVTFSFAYE